MPSYIFKLVFFREKLVVNKQIKEIIKAFYVAEVCKFLLIALLLSIVFYKAQAQHTVIFFAFIATQLSQVLYFWFRLKRGMVIKNELFCRFRR